MTSAVSMRWLRAHPTTRDVGHPDPIRGCRRRHTGQAIGGNGMLMVAVGGSDSITALLPAADSRLSHEPSQAVSTMPLTQSAQAGLDAWAAIGLPTVFVNASDLLLEPQVFLHSGGGLTLPSLPIVIAAGRDGKALTEQGNGMRGLQGVDPLEPLLGGSEMMPKVFFKMSRCWRKRAFSRRRAANSSSLCFSEVAATGP